MQQEINIYIFIYIYSKKMLLVQNFKKRKGQTVIFQLRSIQV